MNADHKTFFQNEKLSHRAHLLELLKRSGFPAQELNSGGGTMHVVVPLFDACYQDKVIIEAQADHLKSKLSEIAQTLRWEAYLYIATNSGDRGSEIGLIGNEAESPDMLRTGTFTETVATFANFWKDRDFWLQEYIAGRLIPNWD